MGKLYRGIDENIELLKLICSLYPIVYFSKKKISYHIDYNGLSSENSQNTFIKNKCDVIFPRLIPP